jgi:hypothetical protein
VPPARNPFNFGDLALDETFADRADELRELKTDILNGQNVVVFGPRRYGKSSLVWRVTQELVHEHDVLVAQVDLMKTVTKEQFAAKLASSIYEEIASPLFRAREKAAQIFRSLRVHPTMTVDPGDGSLAFSFRGGYENEEVDATLERLLELPAELAGDRGARVAVVFDEFQEVLDLDPHLPGLMRAVFQSQPEVAHVYLGSKRSMMEKLFNDENEPFWRSAKQMELDVISAAPFGGFIRERFASTGRGIEDGTIAAILDTTGGHPYATQELCYALWDLVPEGATAGSTELAAALDGVLRSENSHFTRIWDKATRAQRLTLQALAQEPLQSISSDEFRRRHGLPTGSSLYRALDALVADELVAKSGAGRYRIAEPFLAEWILRFGV